MKNNSIFIVNQAGCLLPLLILLNLFFGWMIFKPFTWLAIGLVLMLVFLLNSIIMTRKISTSPKRKGVIDIEGRPIDDIKGIK